MTKYYCDYCDIFLTHDAPRVRKDHNAGWKHAVQVRAHFLAMNQDRMQRTIAEIVKDYEIRRELVPVPAPMMMRPPPGLARPTNGPGMQMGPGAPMGPGMPMGGPGMQPGMAFGMRPPMPMGQYPSGMPIPMGPPGTVHPSFGPGNMSSMAGMPGAPQFPGHFPMNFPPFAQSSSPHQQTNHPHSMQMPSNLPPWTQSSSNQPQSPYPPHGGGMYRE